MRIGIIGAGHVGGTLARRLAALGHEIFVANSREPGTLVALGRETGAMPVTAHEAAHRGEIVIVSVPMKSIRELPRDLFRGVADDVLVVETCNYYPQERDGRIDEIENGMPESAYVESHLGRSVVKAFNTIRAEYLMTKGRPRGDPRRIAMPMAGDDRKAKERIGRLIDELGFDAIDVGGLDESWRQQPGTGVYTADLDASAARRALADEQPGRKADFAFDGKARPLDFAA
jgi:predicted dinucleotide-binding enzyme